MICFFFFKQKTAYEMRISDWSSDCALPICPAFYGTGVRGTLISYAASFGNQNASDGLSDHWASQIGNFASISVRDENSRRMIRTALGHDPDVVLDTCLTRKSVV